MLSLGTIIVIPLMYLGSLFAIASWADRSAMLGRDRMDSALTYTLSLAVYCTAWTFFGSVGLAQTNGLQFLPVYLGPTMMAFLFPVIVTKMLAISKAYGITSIADFIAARFGKSSLLGGLVAIVAVIGTVPYISLQIKAVAISLEAVLEPHVSTSVHVVDIALLIALILAGFSILFGTRHIDATENHKGMVLAIAFESLVKLAAFLCVGIAVTYFVHDGFHDLASKAIDAGHGALLRMEGTGLSYGDWFLLTLVSGFACLALPRQFQVTIIENVDQDHLRTASWLFPLYLFAINLFVLPIALAALLHDGAAGDLAVVILPRDHGFEFVTLFALIGGLSAATAMMAVSTVALSTMISNDLILPMLLRFGRLEFIAQNSLTDFVLTIRRIGITVIALLGYLFYRFVTENQGLVTTGLISFTAVAQFVPLIFAAIYWREANLIGAMAGLIAGVSVWAFCLVVPTFAAAGWIDPALMYQGLFGISFLRPTALFGVEGLHPVSHAVLWSLAANILALIMGSLLFQRDELQRLQALLFVEVFQRREMTRLWRGEVHVADLHRLLTRYLGPLLAETTIDIDARRRGSRVSFVDHADAAFVQLCERQLARAIGAASARVVIASVVRKEIVGLDDLIEILDETTEAIRYSKELEQKSEALMRTSEELKSANERLLQLDRLKDDFMATVSHELRTPLTSIRSFSEILRDTGDISDRDRQKFLNVIVDESKRLSRLLNDLLDLSKIEAGRMDWRIARLDLAEIARGAIASMQGQLDSQNVTLDVHIRSQQAWIEADRDRIMQVVLNLLANAAKFANARAGRIRLTLRRELNAYILAVEDNGSGVPENMREAIFDKFQQIAADLSSKPKGTGLGLTISREIVDRFKGRIWAESSPLGGAAVKFTLPAKN